MTYPPSQPELACLSIALVAVLALATIYYGGTAFIRGTAEAKASQLVQEQRPPGSTPRNLQRTWWDRRS
jgi:hypothetical protein